MLTKSERQTVNEVLNATRVHFEAVSKEAVDGKLLDVAGGMDISISKLELLLKSRGERVKVLHGALKPKQVVKLASKDGRLVVNVQVGLSEFLAFQDCIEDLDNLVDERILTSGVLSDISYRVVGHIPGRKDGSNSGSVILQVNADVSSIVEDAKEEERLDREADAYSKHLDQGK